MVLEIAELLELILLQLPTKDLLFAQKVCKSWHTAITTSTAIQKALFLLPGDYEDVCHDSKEAKTLFGEYEGYTDPMVKRVKTNPLLFDETDFRRFAGEADYTIVGDLPDHLLGSRTRAGCHRMYLTQPPLAFELVYMESPWQIGCLKFAWATTFGAVATRAIGYFSVLCPRRLRAVVLSK